MNGSSEKYQPEEDCADATVAVPEPMSLRAALEDFYRLKDNRWAVLLVLFGAMAALGLPILWFSRGFNLVEKCFWSVIVSLYTALLLWLAWISCVYAWTQVEGLSL